jgi:cell division protein ZapA
VAESTARVVPVEILGQRYPIRSSLDAAYVTELATYVDGKMRAAAQAVPTGDAVRLAVLAALNIADEYFRCRDADKTRQSTLNERAAQVERLLDLALDRLGAPAGGGS